jgi:tRNA(adenine34) deaminase
MNPEEAVKLAMQVAEQGMRKGEMPIGSVVLQGDKIIGRGYTQEKELKRRIVHADLMAMIEADARLGFNRSILPLTLAVNIEPCLMCIGAAITLGINRIWYGLESPNDGAVELLNHWHPPKEQPFFCRPQEIKGGFLREEIQNQFARYALIKSAPKGMRMWALELSQL